MPFIEHRTEGLTRHCTFSTSSAEFESTLLKKMQQPGIADLLSASVPVLLLRNEIGHGSPGDTLREIIDEAVRERCAVDAEQPAGRAAVSVSSEGWQRGQDIVASVTYEVMPEIPDLALTDITIERMAVSVRESDIEDALNSLAVQRCAFAAKSDGEPAALGDQLVVDFTGKVGGVVFDGGSASDFELVLGAGAFAPGFEEQLVGAQHLEERVVSVVFPQTHSSAQLRGREVVFECTVKQVRAPVPATVDDALAHRLGARDLADLRTKVADQVERECEQAIDAVVKARLFEHLEGATSFELPHGRVADEAAFVAQQMSHGEVANEHVEFAERRVRRAALLGKVARQAQLDVTDLEMAHAVMSEARQYPGQEQEFLVHVQGDPELQHRFRDQILEGKAVEHVLGQATVRTVEASREELLQALEAIGGV